MQPPHKSDDICFSAKSKSCSGSHSFGRCWRSEGVPIYAIIDYVQQLRSKSYVLKLTLFRLTGNAYDRVSVHLLTRIHEPRLQGLWTLSSATVRVNNSPPGSSTSVDYLWPK